MSSTNRTEIRYVAETTWSQTPNNPTMKVFRDTDDSLVYNISSTQSNEISSDRQVSDLILLGGEASGAINWELSYGNGDDFIESALFSSWSNDLGISATDISASATDNSFNSTSTDFSSVEVGQWIKVDGFTNSENNGYFQVTSVSTNKLIVTAGTLVDEAAGNTITINGSTIKNGTTMKSFTIERVHSDVSQYFQFLGMVVSGMSLRAAANSIVTGSFNFVGKSASRSGSSIASSVTPATTEDVMNAVSNVADIREGGTVLSDIFIQELTFNVANNIRGLSAIGYQGNADLSEGDFVVTGTINTYFSDGTLYDKFINNNETSISFRVTKGSHTYIFTWPKVKYSSSSINVPGRNQDVMQNLGWQAMKHPTYGFTMRIDRF